MKDLIPITIIKRPVNHLEIAGPNVMFCIFSGAKTFLSACRFWILPLKPLHEASL